jgi:hypothetical protein
LRRTERGGSVRAVGVAWMHPGRQAGRWLAVIGACVALSALAAAPALAVNVSVDGSPLNITANDRGVLQIAFDGSATGEFYPAPADPAYAGFTAALRAATTAPFQVFSYTSGGGFRFTPTASQPPSVAGDGSPGNPFVLSAHYDAVNAQPQTLAHVDQTLSYVNGSSDVTANYVITNALVSGGPLLARLFTSGDLVVAGNTTGAGFFLGGPPRQVGGRNPLSLGSGSLVEATPWSAYQEGTFSTVSNAVHATAATATGLNNTVVPQIVDSAIAAQWDTTLQPSQPQTFSVTWRFTRTSPLDLVAVSPTQALGQTATVNVTARNADGSPDPGRSVRYSIAGANPSSGAVTTAASGTAAISWMGTKLGTDTLTAFIDRDGNGSRDVNTEPQQTATVTWTPPPPPVPGKSVVVTVVSGQVFIKRPASGRARQATGPAKGFVPFAGAANIPVGSQLDTRKGRVALTSAVDTGGAKTQTSDFYQGIFQVKQALPKKKPKKATALTTDLVMKGQIARSQCAPLKGARAAAEAAKKKKKGPKAVLGKLWGSGKGKFRTNGKYSAATVRGTIWLVQDRCEGTLTKVTRGTVQVRDFKRKKTVTVKAGHSYLARAQRAASKAKRR